MLETAELDTIARHVAAQVPPLRDDIWGETWVRFMRYRPRTRSGAWLMAFSARVDLLRKERRQLELPQRLRDGTVAKASAGLRARWKGHIKQTDEERAALANAYRHSPEFKERRRLYMQEYRQKKGREHEKRLS